MLKIITKSGSIYFIDLANNVFKRQPSNDTRQLSVDNFWENFGHIAPSPIKIGEPLYFFYYKSSDSKFINTIKTSRVVDIIEINDNIFL